MSRPPRTLQGRPDREAPARGVDAGHTWRPAGQCPRGCAQARARADDACAAMHLAAACERDASTERNIAAAGEPD